MRLGEGMNELHVAHYQEVLAERDRLRAEVERLRRVTEVAALIQRGIQHESWDYLRSRDWVYRHGIHFSHRERSRGRTIPDATALEIELNIALEELKQG